MTRNAKVMVTMATGLVALAALGYWALPQFRGSLLNFIILACVLICPLSMLFMMRGKQPDRDKQVRHD